MVIPPIGLIASMHRKVLPRFRRASLMDEVPVPSFSSRMVCTICGAIGVDVGPNWQERASPSLFGGAQWT
jgi:hypothetical protein